MGKQKKRFSFDCPLDTFTPHPFPPISRNSFVRRSSGSPLLMLTTCSNLWHKRPSHSQPPNHPLPLPSSTPLNPFRLWPLLCRPVSGHSSFFFLHWPFSERTPSGHINYMIFALFWHNVHINDTRNYVVNRKGVGKIRGLKNIATYVLMTMFWCRWIGHLIYCLL